MLSKQNYKTLLDEISEKADLIEKNLHENYLNSCTCYQDLEYRTYIQFNEDGKITKIFNDGFMPNTRKDLNRDDTICIAALTASTANYDSLFYQKQQQIEAEVEKELNEKLNELNEEDEIEIELLKEEYNDILNARIEQITVTDEELLAMYDTGNDFSDLHEYLEYLINYENDTI